VSFTAKNASNEKICLNQNGEQKQQLNQAEASDQGGRATRKGKGSEEIKLTGMLAISSERYPP